MRRSGFSAAALALVGVLALGASSALAGGPPVVNTTEHLVNAPDTFDDFHPCTGEPIRVTTLDTGVIHTLVFADGTIRIHGSLHSVFSGDLIPVDGIPDATGSFTSHFTNNGALGEDEVFGKAVANFTANGVITNPDGSSVRFHLNAHLVFDADGIPKLETFKARCH